MHADNDNKPRLMAAEGQFPQPVKLGDRRIAYVRAEVDAWIDQRIAARPIEPANDNTKNRREVA